MRSKKRIVDSVSTGASVETFVPLAPAVLAQQHLQKHDPVLRRVIAEIGPPQLDPRKRQPYEALIRAIAYQQLHARAAETILGRFFELFPAGKFPKPEQLLAVPEEVLRGVGFSRAKVAALLDIAKQRQAGVIPTLREVQRLTDEAIIERLTAVRGVGQWTVEMLLIFQLGRPDVLPVDDFGVRKGFQIAYKHSEPVTPKALRAFGERWRPFRSYAAWYMWRVADRAKLKPTI